MELRRLIRDTCQPDRAEFVLPLMNLHPVEIVGWAMYERITTALTLRELQQAYALRKPPGGLMHHSDRGSKYTSRAYRKQLSKYGIRSSMSGKGNCYDNAIFERFFGSLKYE
jgi:putative transposase